MTVFVLRFRNRNISFLLHAVKLISLLVAKHGSHSVSFGVSFLKGTLSEEGGGGRMKTKTSLKS